MKTLPPLSPMPVDVRASGGLSQRAAAGVAWSTMSTAGKQLLSIASVATVARLLGPGAYGIMAMANLVIAFVVNFRDLGTGTAIIQRPTISERLLSSLFWVNCGLGIMLAVGVIAASPFTARFFGHAELVAILCTISVSLWLSSVGVVPNSLLIREMRFKAIAVVELGSALVAYGVALGCAYSGFGVWSLVYANIANVLTSTVGYWAVSHWRPRADFSREEIRSVTGFSLHLSGFGLVNYVSRNADNVIVGRLLGAAPLGNYQVAYNLMLTPLQNISSVIAQVTLPGFAQIQNDDQRFRSAYLRSSSIISLITFPVMAGMGIVADPLIRAILGQKWLGAIPIFQILAPVGFVQSVQTLVGSIYIAKARTDWMFRFGVYNCVVVVIAFLVGVRFGTVGVALAYAIAYFGFIVYPGFRIPFRLIGLAISDFVKALLPQAALSAAMAGICWAWLNGLYAMTVSNVWVRLLSSSAVGAIVYVLGMAILRPRALQYAVEVFSESSNPLAVRTVPMLRRIAGMGLRKAEAPSLSA
jgi:PST family polysaccharide transporter